MDKFSRLKIFLWRQLWDALVAHSIKTDTSRKYYLVYILIETLAQEKLFHNHNTVDYETLKAEAYRIIKGYLLLEQG